jgi:hypothetical protein
MPAEALDPLAGVAANSTECVDVPDEWKEGVIVPIPKPGKIVSEKSSHRPTTLAGVVGIRVVERVVAEKFRKHPDDNFGRQHATAAWVSAKACV